MQESADWFILCSVFCLNSVLPLQFKGQLVPPTGFQCANSSTVDRQGRETCSRQTEFKMELVLLPFQSHLEPGPLRPLWLQ